MLSMIGGLINKESMKEDIKDLFAFDVDFDGTNGEEYLTEDAFKGGFRSNLDYYYSKFKKEYGSDTEKIINGLINTICEFDYYYTDMQFDSYMIDKDTYYVSIAYTVQ